MVFFLRILAEQTKRIEKRLGGLLTQQALTFLEANNLNQWLEIILNYYDKTYAHSNTKRENSTCLKVPFKWTDPDVSVRKVLLAKKQIIQ